MRLVPKRRSVARRNGVSEVIAILLLVVIVLIMVGVVLIFGTSVIHDLISGGVATPLTASGQMVVPGTTSDGAVLTLSLRNSQAQAISGIAVTCVGSFSVTANCVTMTYNNNPIVAPTTVPPGGSTLGTGPVTALGGPFVAGTTYSVLLAVSFAGGSEVTLDVSVTAVS